MADRTRASYAVVDKVLPATENLFEIAIILALFSEFNDDFSVLQYAAWQRLVTNNVNCSISNMPSSLNNNGGDVMKKILVMLCAIVHFLKEVICL